MSWTGLGLRMNYFKGKMTIDDNRIVIVERTPHNRSLLL